jgi:hypothetical protein
MKLLEDQWLVDAYYESIISNLDEPFIDLLLMEILTRKIPIVCIDDVEYAVPYLQAES